MAPKIPVVPLTDDQIARAEWLFLHHSDNCTWIAKHLHADPRAVASACRAGGWKHAKALRMLVATQAAKRSAEDKALRDAEQDERLAEVARQELNLRASLLAKAVKAVDSMTPTEAMRALRNLSGTKDLQAVERLAAGRSTDKTEIDTGLVAYEDVMARLTHAAEAAPDDPNGSGGATKDPARPS
jgi:hypothetical protein